MATFGTDGKRNPENDKSGAKKPRTFKDAKNSPKSDKPAVTTSPGQILVKNCKICSSPSRRNIERLIVHGMKQIDVVRQWEELGEKFTPNSMSTHVRKHMTLGDAVTRRMIERQSEKAFQDIDEDADTLLTTRGVLEVMRQRAFETIVDHKSTIEPETLLKVLDKIDVMNQRDQQIQIDEMMVELNALLKAVKDIVPETTWQKIAEQFQTNLALARDKRQLMERS